MGELNTDKPLHCLICDSQVVINQSYSIFYTFITNSGILLANSLEKNLALKDIGSLSLRSNLICAKCFGYFEQLTTCESKIVKLKGDLWTVYKETCEKHGEKAETHIKGVSTQTDYYTFECHCQSKQSQFNLSLKCENTIQDKEDNGIDNSKKGIKETGNADEGFVKSETVKSEEEITVDADPHVADEDVSKWRKRPETCKLCGKWFKKVSELDNHMVAHTEMDKDSTEKSEYKLKEKKKFHSCSICNKKFRRPCEVKEHMMSHKSATPFICKYCGKKLKSKTGAIYHTLKTHKIDIGNSKKLEEHFHLDVIQTKSLEIENNEKEGEDVKEPSIEDVEKKKKKKKKGSTLEDSCTSSEDELPLARRRKDLMNRKMLRKDVANEDQSSSEKKSKTVNKETLQEVKKWRDVSVSKVSKCREDENVPSNTAADIQDDIFSTLAEKAENEDMKGCKIPDLSTASEETFGTRCQEIGEAAVLSPPVPPGTSGDGAGTEVTREKKKSRSKKYNQLNNLIKLKRSKDASLFPPPMKEPKFKCDICGKMWKTRGELNAHKITHSDARPYICEICGQAYKHKPALDVHVGMHRGIYHHQCSYCHKAFTQKGALQRHLPIHTGDLPYQCELCGKRFVHRTSFSIHTMAHTGIRNIRCKICNLGVLSKSHLRRHMRIHTGEKPYDCQTCGKAFAERYNLVAHQRIHDPNLVGPARQQKKKLQSCRLCNSTFDRRHKLEDHMVTVHNKVVEDVARPLVFEPGEGSGGSGFAADSRFSDDRCDPRKLNERETQDEKNSLIETSSSSSSNPNDLSVRNVQNIHNSHLRNLELIRNLENNRNFELIRMTNGIGGIGGVEETLRIAATSSAVAVPWTYVNPGS